MPETDEPNALERPQWACSTCLPPSSSRTWTRADPGYATCSACIDRIRERMKEVAARYLQLDPRPGASNEHGTRGAPGFGSRPPLNVGIVVMRDVRSSRDARVWMGADGRVHAEDERPSLSVQSALSGVAWAVAEHRNVSGPEDSSDVYELIRWLDRHSDHIGRHGELAVELDQTLRELLAQLRPVTGDARKKIGECPNTLDEGESTRECKAPLYVPINGSDIIECRACGRKWARAEWLHLGDTMSDPREPHSR